MKIKVFLVEGTPGRILPGNKREQSLQKDMEKAINDAFQAIENDGGEIVDVRTETDFASMATGGSSLVVIRYKPAPTVTGQKHKEVEAPSEVEQVKPKKIGKQKI